MVAMRLTLGSRRKVTASRTRSGRDIVGSDMVTGCVWLCHPNLVEGITGYMFRQDICRKQLRLLKATSPRRG